MKRMKYLAALGAICAVALGATSASAAVTVSPAGPYTIAFPVNGITFSTSGSPLGSWTCPMNLGGTVNSAGATTVTTATISPNPCSTQKYTFNLPWSGQITGTPGSYVDVIPAKFNILALGGLFNCDYTGNLRLRLFSGSAAVLPEAQFTASNPSCPKLTVAGAGGKLDHALTISGSA